MNEAAFIATIREWPDEDGPRLVYADWLEETGETSRSEFIRVQIELESYSGWPCSKSMLELFGRQQEMFAEHREEWCRGLYPGILDNVPFWSRGLIESIRISWGNWSVHAAEILAAHPVQEVTITTNSLSLLPESDEVWLKRVWPGIRRWKLPDVDLWQAYLRPDGPR